VTSIVASCHSVKLYVLPLGPSDRNTAWSF